MPEFGKICNLSMQLVMKCVRGLNGFALSREAVHGQVCSDD